ncbi:CRISPR-associated protein Cmr1 [Tepidamorphus gemmatus]|uniref:CRISPR-associated protein Cmr1 n=1 Tax=Tepidamorphus gemmatus TaxID=747076 RepID=A0A4R3MFY9_9HYPH|nr:CRISPR-associated protein Cmr1 [Tepidamorphus gemmatus]
MSELDRTPHGADAPGAPRTWCLKALTDIWTGDAERKGDRLIPTGLLGSIRWWFEVVVRGLGGSACDPTEHQCPDRQKKLHEAGHHCVVCELFGCTGWARKFRFDVLDGNEQIKTTQIKKDNAFKLRFTPLRRIEQEEWALLDLTLRLIAKYGAIGGKTVYKPSDESARQSQAHHRDYGIVQINGAPTIEKRKLNQLKAYVSRSEWRTLNHGAYAWASLANFWCVPGRYLVRQNGNESTFNRVLGRKEPKNQGQQLRDKAECVDKWLAGKQQESKKVFSFKDPPRTFGFVKPGVIDFVAMRQRLKQTWSDLKDEEFIEGPALLDRLLGEGGGATE